MVINRLLTGMILQVGTNKAIWLLWASNELQNQTFSSKDLYLGKLLYKFRNLSSWHFGKILLLNHHLGWPANHSTQHEKINDTAVSTPPFCFHWTGPSLLCPVGANHPHLALKNCSSLYVQPSWAIEHGFRNRFDTWHEMHECLHVCFRYLSMFTFFLVCPLYFHRSPTCSVLPNVQNFCFIGTGQ